MNSPIRAPSTSSCSYIRPHSCRTCASRNFKLPLLLPQAICTAQKLHRCSGGHTEASSNANPLKTCIVGKFSPGWSEAQPLVSKQSLNRHLLPVEALVTSTTQDVSDTPLIGDDKIGVLLLNLGGPETLDDVQPFLFNLFADPDIIRLPRLFSFLQKPLAQFVSVLRAPKSKEGYASIGGGSPLRRMTDAQAEELRKSLFEKNVPANVYVGMRYWHPFTEEAIELIKRDGITKLVVLPLYPQFSISTSGSSSTTTTLNSQVIENYSFLKPTNSLPFSLLILCFPEKNKDILKLIFSRRKKHPQNMSDALINGLAGAGGGIIAQLITYPLQTVNTRQQTDRDPKKGNKNLGTFQQMCQVVKQEGWERLYGGLAPSLVGTATSQGVYYYFYQIFRNRAEAAALENMRLGSGDGSVGMFSSLIVAALSGCVNVLLTNPIWLVVTRMQTHRKESRKTLPDPRLSDAIEQTSLSTVEPLAYGTSHVIQEVYDEAGVLGFWKGVLPTLVMVSNPSIQFMLYETLLAKLKKRRASSSVTALEIFLLGAVAKLGATVVTYPLLVVKARLQARQVNNGDKRYNYKGTQDAIIKMIRYEGFNGFYKGMGTKIVQSVLAAAVLFMVKEKLVEQTRSLLAKNVPNTLKPKVV